MSSALPTPSIWNVTPATPTSSAASALIVIVPATVEPSAGEVMATVGGVVSFVVTVNALALVAVPPGVVTLIGPLVAPAGTVA